MQEICTPLGVPQNNERAACCFSSLRSVSNFVDDSLGCPEILTYFIPILPYTVPIITLY